MNDEAIVEVIAAACWEDVGDLGRTQARAYDKATSILAALRSQGFDVVLKEKA